MHIIRLLLRAKQDAAINDVRSKGYYSLRSKNQLNLQALVKSS